MSAPDDGIKVKNKKKILVFSQHFYPEEFRVNDLCRGFVEHGFYVDVICGIPNYPTGKVYKGWGFFNRREEVWNGVNIHRVWEIPRGNNKLFMILMNFVSWPLFCLFKLPFIRGRYDRILSYQLSPVFMAFPAIVYKFFTGTPLFIYILDFWPFSVFAVMNIKIKFFKKLIYKCSQWHYRKADGLIGAFEGIKDKLIDEMGIESNRIIYVPQACEKIHETKIYDKELHEKYDKFFNIVFTGSINPAQSFETIIPAAKLCYDKGYRDIHWIIVGDGMSRQAVEKMVCEAKLTKNFHFEGSHPVDDLPKYYNIADAFVVALKKSQLGDFGIPAKVQSYLAAGKPIVGAMDGDGGVLINENQLGYCGSADDTSTLCENIIRIYLLSEEERIKMGERAKAYHFKNFERDRQLKKIIDFALT